jgi:acyl carrier protein
MNEEQLRTLVLKALTDVAPEADASAVAGGEPLQEQFDLDSMDYLQFLENVSEASGIDIPERDYGELATVDACVGYLSARVPV